MLNKLRIRLKEEIQKTLDLPQEFFMTDKRGKTFFARLEFEKYRWKIFPVYKVVRQRAIFVGKKTQEFCRSIVAKLENVARRISELITSALAKEVKNSIENAQKEFLADINKRYGEFHANFVRKVLQKGQNEYRRILLEKMRESAREIFVTQTHRYLAMFLLKLQEEFGDPKEDNTTGILNECALPDNIRFAFYGKGGGVFVVEQPPQVHTVAFRMDDSGAKRFSLAFPFVIFIVGVKQDQITSMKVFFRNQPLRQRTDTLFCPALPNIQTRDFYVCFPKPKEKGTPREVITAAIQNFWGSDFNQDFSELFRRAMYRLPEIASLEKWSMASRNDSLFTTGLAWESSGFTVEQVVYAMVRNMDINSRSTEETSFVTAEKYLKRIAESAGGAIQEACFALIEGYQIKEDSEVVAVSTELARLLAQSYNNLCARLEREVQQTFSDEKINLVIQEAVAAAINEVKTEVTGIMTAVPQELSEVFVASLS